MVSPIGLGTMQWGSMKVQFEPASSSSSASDIFQKSLELGVIFFDTAEMYGFGRSETLLGKCYRDVSTDIIIATKFMPIPWRLSKKALRNALVMSIRRLGVPHIDLYQVHWPFPPVPIRTWMDAMADMVADGLVRAVGVSNYSVSQTEKAFDQLNKHGIPLASNQVKFSLLDRGPDQSGLVTLCKDLGITIIAYSPLEIGILTGKYDVNNPPSDIRSWRYNRNYLKKVEPLLNKLKEIGMKNSGKTPGQVSLNWLICRGIVPIPGAKNTAQAVENAGAMGWYLTPEEVDQLDRLSEELLQ